MVEISIRFALSPIKVPISTWRGFGGIQEPLPQDQEDGEVRWLEWWKVGFDLFESNQSPNFNLEGVWWYSRTTLSDEESEGVRWMAWWNVGFHLFESNQSPNFNLEGVWWYSSTTLSRRRGEGYGGWHGGMLGSICLSPIKVLISTWRGFGGIRAQPSPDEEVKGYGGWNGGMLGSICLSPIKVPISTWRGSGGIRAPPLS